MPHTPSIRCVLGAITLQTRICHARRLLRCLIHNQAAAAEVCVRDIWMIELCVPHARTDCHHTGMHVWSLKPHHRHFSGPSGELPVLNWPRAHLQPRITSACTRVFIRLERVCGVMSASCVHVTVCACVRATTNRTAFVGTRNGMHTHTHMMEKLANETAIIALTIIDATYSIVRFRSARVPFCIHAERQIKTCLFRQPRPLFAHERSPNYRFSYAP